MIGELLGNYRIVAKLGSGSMGVVFLGEHQRLVRRAAIKLLAPHLVRNQHVLQRFFNEALATSVIRHPGIVDVFDCDVDANGRAYMVMEHLEGETLGDRLQQEGRLHWRQACLIVRQAAEALGAVHDKGIIHRDLKPENLFLLLDPRDATAVVVKVLDFGVARLLAQEPASRLTMRGVLLGTPEYMCPEQCAGAEIDHRADVYALGCILFEMLGGLPPYVAETVQDLIAAHQYFPVPPLREPVAEIPTWLTELLARMLAKEPGERPASMHEIAKELRAHEATAAPAASSVAVRPVVEPSAGADAPPGPSRSGGDWRALVGRRGARRAATAFALAAVFVLTGVVWSALRKPVAGARAANAQTLVTGEVGVPAAPLRAAHEALMSQPAALPAAAAIPATAAAPPGLGTVSAPAPRERRPERAARAARPARPASPPRHVDSDGIVDL